MTSFYLTKYKKYHSKNMKGSGIAAALKAAQKAKEAYDKGEKKVVESANKAAEILKKSKSKIEKVGIKTANTTATSLKETKKEIEKEKNTIIELLDEEKYKKLIKYLDELIDLLSASNLSEIVSKKEEIIKLVGELNDVVQSDDFPLDDIIKKRIEKIKPTIEEILDMIKEALKATDNLISILSEKKLSDITSKKDEILSLLETFNKIVQSDKFPLDDETKKSIDDFNSLVKLIA